MRSPQMVVISSPNPRRPAYCFGDVVENRPFERPHESGLLHARRPTQSETVLNLLNG